MKVAWYSVPLAPAPAGAGTCFAGARSFERRNVFVGKTTRLHAAHMNHRCNCGMQYVVIPKEIPLTKSEALICPNRGCELKGRWSARYFDYEPSLVLPEEERGN